MVVSTSCNEEQKYEEREARRAFLNPILESLGAGGRVRVGVREQTETTETTETVRTKTARACAHTIGSAAVIHVHTTVSTTFLYGAQIQHIYHRHPRPPRRPAMLHPRHLLSEMTKT